MRFNTMRWRVMMVISKMKKKMTYRRLETCLLPIGLFKRGIMNQMSRVCHAIWSVTTSKLKVKCVSSLLIMDAVEIGIKKKKMTLRMRMSSFSRKRKIRVAL